MRREATVIIPNYNGIKYIRDCLDSLKEQTMEAAVIVVDNGSTDGSCAIIREYPNVDLVELPENYGFCRAVNEGIKRADTPYVILLNNDTRADKDFVRELVLAIKDRPGTFSAASKMLQMGRPDLIDSAGDLYCALGWAFSLGKDSKKEGYDKEARVFSACAGAAIYDTGLLKEIGGFDERHISYLEDVDVGYRARIRGLVNRYAPKAIVYHAGSGVTGSRHNAYKVRQAARNSVYVLYKNMPFAQMILNMPFWLAGFIIKALYFTKKGFGSEYMSGIMDGCRICTRDKKVPFKAGYLGNYIRIQIELWINVVRRFAH